MHSRNESTIQARNSQVGATIEAVHAQGWHTMHGRALCDIYNMKTDFPSVCGKNAVKSIRCVRAARLHLLIIPPLVLFHGCTVHEASVGRACALQLSSLCYGSLV